MKALLLMALAGCASVETGRTFKQLRYPYATRHVSVDGIDVPYVDEGDGDRTVLLVHGLGSNLTVWKHTIAALSTDYRVVAIDLPGYGRSAKASYRYSMAFFARVVDVVIDRLHL